MVKKACTVQSDDKGSSTSVASGPNKDNGKRKPHNNYKFINFSKRVDVIYDNFVHDKQPIDISHLRELKYNTVRSILQNFYQNGRINVKKKMSGYTKGLKKDKVSALPKAAPKQVMQKPKGRSRRKTVRPYRRVFAQNKLLEQENIVNNTQIQEEVLDQSEKHVNFVRMGPQKISLADHQSKCPFGLFVAQYDDPDHNLKTDQLSMFKSNDGYYPYNVYDILQDDIDKQESKKGDLDALFEKLLKHMGKSNLCKVDDEDKRGASNETTSATSNVLLKNISQKEVREQEAQKQNLKLLSNLCYIKPPSKESSEQISEDNDGTLSSVSCIE